MEKELTKTHYFLAIPIPQDIKQLYMQWRELAQERLPFKSWVHHEDYHITLSFLGDAPFSKINEVKKEMSCIAEEQSPFRIQLSGLGFFGKPENPRIFWSGIEAQPALTCLQRDVHQACEKIGFELEQRPYRPHLTLARRWAGAGLFPANELSELFQPKKELLSFSAEQIVLYQSHLNRSPKYQPLSIFSFQQ